MPSIAVTNTLQEAKEILDALSKGERLQYRPLGRDVDWKDCSPLPFLPDFHTSRYRVKPSATWIVVFERGHGPMVGSVHCEHLAAAINIAIYSNTGGRKLLYVVKVEDDVATIQKTPS